RVADVETDRGVAEVQLAVEPFAKRPRRRKGIRDHFQRQPNARRTAGVGDGLETAAERPRVVVARWNRLSLRQTEVKHDHRTAKIARRGNRRDRFVYRLTPGRGVRRGVRERAAPDAVDEAVADG